MKTVVVDEVEYVPKNAIISDTTMSQLRQAYGIAWGNSVYDPPCSCASSIKTIRDIMECLREANKELHFKK